MRKPGKSTSPRPALIKVAGAKRGLGITITDRLLEDNGGQVVIKIPEGVRVRIPDLKYGNTKTFTGPVEMVYEDEDNALLSSAPLN